MSEQKNDEFAALQQSCAAHPGSAVLLRTMLAEATRSGQVPAATRFLNTVDPAAYEESVRPEVATLPR